MSLRDHRVFLVALLAGAGVRVAVQVSFPPGFIFSDGPTYLALVDDLRPFADRVVGYGVLLRGLDLLAREVWLITAVQHVLGLITAALAYALLRRWGVGGSLATLATVPMLFDAMALMLEHSVLSDVLFDLLMAAGVVALAWRRSPTVSTAVLGGALLGLAVCVRVVGQPLVLAAVAFCLVAAPGLRAKVLTSLAVCVAFAVPVVAYVGWYHQTNDAWALSESGGRALYMRTTGFVDCTAFAVPDYERPLCPAEPLGSRLDPTDYGWHTPDGTHGLRPPDGVTTDEAMHDFAVRAIKAQPGDYARIVWRDLALNFTAPRVDSFEYDTAFKWTFVSYVDYRTTGWTRPAYAAHGGDQPRSRQPLADRVVRYGDSAYTYGPLLLALLVVGLLGLVVRRRGTQSNRPLILLALLVGVGLMTAPVVTAEFVWRYQMPAVVLLPVAAVLTIAGLRRPVQPATTAVPSTD